MEKSKNFEKPGPGKPQKILKKPQKCRKIEKSRENS